MKTNQAEPGFDRRRFLRQIATGVLGTGAVTIGPGASAWTGQQTNSVLNQARPDSARLKIARVTPYIMRFQKHPVVGRGCWNREEMEVNRQRGVKEQFLSGVFFLLCRVETEEGLVGWGDGSSWSNVVTIASEIEMAAPYLVGRSAWDIESIWMSIWNRRQSSHGASVMAAISAIDIALWDIVGQKLNVPVYKLLGGKVNSRIRIYTGYPFVEVPSTAEAYAAKTTELIAKGVVAAKWAPFGDGSLASIHRAIETVRGVREAGVNFEICLKGGIRNIPNAIRIAKALEPYSVLFLEEVLLSENSDAFVQVQNATSTPLAAGERIKGRLEAREYIERGALRVLQPDVVCCGGITEFRKMVSMAETHYVPFAPHNPNSPVSLAAHLHLSASSHDFLILEEAYTDPLLCKELFGEWQDNRGYFLPPEGTGLA